MAVSRAQEAAALKIQSLQRGKAVRAVSPLRGNRGERAEASGEAEQQLSVQLSIDGELGAFEEDSFAVACSQQVGGAGMAKVVSAKRSFLSKRKMTVGMVMGAASAEGVTGDAQVTEPLCGW